ncbi:MAG TPA: hypothetical protein VHA37_07910, partial [Candidatus Saccharimonadales bacterium]|nr:hypothetical protein [Candidatus Saccharimonadales bacterium]
IFLFTVSLASALSLYWLVSGLVAFIQQSFILRKDEEEMEGITDKKAAAGSRDLSSIPEAEVIEPALGSKTGPNIKTDKAKKTAKTKKKRRKK